MNMFGNKPLLSMISKNKLMIDDEIYRWPLRYERKITSFS